MAISPALEPLIKSRHFPLYVEEMQSRMEAERRRREEFYDWITEDIKAEFINGEVVVQSPAKDQHTEASMNLAMLFKVYVDEHNLGIVRAETTLVTLTRNDYLPDICFFGEQKAGFISHDQMKYPAPDLVVEILSPSTARVDRTTKFDDYADHGVGEYWLVNPEARTVEQFVLRDGEYELLFKLREGTITSEVVQGFAIPVEAIFDDKLKNRVLVGLISAETP